MSYETPELLLVGAAQNLVLGINPKSTLHDNLDPDDENYDVVGLPDGGSW